MGNESTLLFVSQNRHKVEEMKKFLPPPYRLLGLQDIQWAEEIAEPYDTFEENAAAKVSLVFEKTGMACFADDSGLVVEALHHQPGVLSARYAGEHKSNQDNILKVLLELGNTSHRNARFVAVIAFQQRREEVVLFKGNVEGSIALHPAGEGGFGYDPIFIPKGFDATFAQLSPTIKHLISHRAKAMEQFVSFLKMNVTGMQPSDP